MQRWTVWPYDGELADVWALGVTTFTAAAGFLPFDGVQTGKPVFDKVLRAQQAGELGSV